jgi:hypothetical protein
LNQEVLAALSQHQIDAPVGSAHRIVDDRISPLPKCLRYKNLELRPRHGINRTCAAGTRLAMKNPAT